MEPADRRVTRTAASQYGVVSREQCLEAGLTERTVLRRVQQGALERLGPNSFRIAGAPPTWHGAVRAALFDAGPSALVSHRSAARLHHFDGFRDDLVEVLMPHRARRRVAGVVVHGTHRLQRSDRTVVDGLPATTPMRTVFDLAAVVDRDALARAVDAAVRDGGVTVAGLQRRLRTERRTGLAGVRALDAVLPDSGGHSRLERMFLALCRRFALPRPVLQQVHRARGRFVARVDFRFAGSDLVVEVNGQAAHVTRTQRARDAERQAELLLLGIRVLTFTYEQVRDRPEWVAGTVALALGPGA